MTQPTLVPFPMIPQWRPASYGTGKMHWYLIRDRNGSDGRGTFETAETATGQYHRFGSFDAAAKAAHTWGADA